MKATFRLPEPLLDELRKRSKQEGVPINSIAIEALRRGLGHHMVDRDVSEVLGSFIAQNAVAVYDAANVERRVSDIGMDEAHLAEALEWVRGDL